MRVLAVEPGPAFSTLDVHRGWVKAFRQAGCTVADYNLGARLSFYELAHAPQDDGGYRKMLDDGEAIMLAAKGLLAAGYEFLPDLLFVTSGPFVPTGVLDTFRDRGVTVVLLHTESPYEEGRQLARAAHADINLINDPTHLARYQQLGPAWYAPHCYDPDVHHPGTVERTVDVSIVGTGYRSRIDLLEQVCWDGIDLALGGNWQALAERSPLRDLVVHDLDGCMDNADAADLYRLSKMSVNLYRAEADQPELADGWACGPREIELAACGTFFLRHSRPESDALFPMLPTFDGPADLEDQIRWWLGHDTARQEAAEMARQAVADRTFGTSAAGLLKAVANL